MQLLIRVLIGIVAGVAVGNFLPMWLLRTIATFNGLFGQLLQFIVPLLIIGFVTPAIASVGRSAGRLLGVTAALAYLMTVCAGLLSFGTAQWLFPSMIGTATNEDFSQAVNDVAPFFSLEITPIMGVLSALIFAIMLGVGITQLPTKSLAHGAEEFRTIIERTIRGVIIPLLPIYIFGIFVMMVHQGQVARVLTVFAKIIGVIFVLHIVLLLLQYSVAGLVSRRNPLKALWTMLPAYVTALGSQSSAITIPVTLEQSKKTGVDPSIAGFVIPLCATIHLSGSMLKITACALALMLMQGIPYDTPQMIGFICLLALTMVAAPGVPGGAIMAALGVLQSNLGFSQADQALMIALYIAMDSFGTAGNVTGDGAIALIVNRIWRGRKVQTVAEEA